MSSSSLRLVERAPPAPRREVVPSGVLGMLIFVIVEAMIFAGFISAFTIARANAPGQIWPPPGQPRLPIEETAVNTAALLLSGLIMFLAHRAFQKDPARARVPLAISIGLGAFFVLFQGMEWVQLLEQGLTLTSSSQGGFFYLIVGAHGLHVIGALGLLAVVMARLLRGTLSNNTFAAAQVLWYFVVGLWPILYAKVYL